MSQAHEPQAQTETESKSTAGGPKTISGRGLTVWVIILLVVLGGSLVFALSSFSGIDDARKQKKEAWSGLREAMDARYRSIEKVVAAGVDERTIPMEWGEKFRLELDSFRTTAQVSEQHKQALELERLLSTADFTMELPAVEGDLASRSDALQAAVDAENDALDSIGGQLLGIFFRFERPVPLQLAQ